MVLNWNRCVICQQDTAEPLKCPLKSLRASGDKSDAYKSFLSNVEQFWAIYAVPAEVYFGKEETAESFVAHSASWQKSCHLKFNDIKLAKAKKKRDHTPTDEQKRPKKRKALDVQGCFFCEKGGEGMFSVRCQHSTLEYTWGCHGMFWLDYSPHRSRRSIVWHSRLIPKSSLSN